MYYVRSSSGVPIFTIRMVRNLFKWFNNNLPTDHVVPIYLCCCRTFDFDGDLAAGIFRYRGKSCNIKIAGLRHIDEVLTTCLHEFVHFEQFSSGRSLTERGVRVRMRSLEDLILSDWFL